MLSQYSSLLYNTDPVTPTQRRIRIQQLRYQLQNSVSCLTETPQQFLAIDYLQAGQEALKLKDNLADIVDIVVNRIDDLP